MSVNLPNVRNITLPELPDKFKNDKELHDFLWKLKQLLEMTHVSAFDNVSAIQSVINTGTSGTFVTSGGATITITDGLITGIS